MKGLRYIIMFLLCCLVWNAVEAQATDSMQAVFKQYFLSKKEFSGNVHVVQENEVLFSQSFGYADLELKSEVSLATRFRIGSITKSFTAMGIMLLVEQGKIKLEDRVHNYMTEIPESWREITIYHLLSHTAGLVHTWEAASFKKNAKEELSTDEVLQLFYLIPLLFSPGKEHHYSGLGYITLARIIEIVSEKSYEDFIREKILIPAGMENSGFDNPYEIIHHRAKGYEERKGIIVNAQYIYMPLLKGSGNMYSTVEDLVKWDKALHENLIISQQSKEKIFSTRAKSLAKLDLQPKTKHEIGRMVQHRGSVPGFFANVVRFPDVNAVIVLLTNQRYLDNGSTANEFTKMVKGYLLTE